VLAPFFGFFLVNAAQRPKQFLKQLLRWDTEYHPDGAYAPGLHFSATDTGITGSAIAPTRMSDSLVVVNQSGDCLILRSGQKGWRVVGSAYIGKIGSEGLERLSTPWERITIE
jgi:hypothetical protein